MKLLKRVKSFAFDNRILVLALLTGMGTGVLALVFREGVHALENLVAGTHLPAGWPLWLVRFLAPALGGLVVGLLLYRLLHLYWGHGVPAVIQGVAEGKPMDNPKVALTAASSAITLGSGGSAGPEGPIVEFGAVFGSYAWRWSRLSPEHLRTMVGCGSAAGMAAVFGAPIGGVVFVMEVVLRDFRLKTLAPVMLASVAASAITAARFGLEPTIELVGPFHTNYMTLLLSPILALACAALAVLFIQVSEKLSKRINQWPLPVWLKPALGGLGVGAVAIFLPQVQGLGYEHIENMASLPWLIVLFVIFAKIFCTALTLSSGSPGGAFAPALVIGAALGVAFARLVGLDPMSTLLMAMAGLIAGTFQAPLSALLIMLKLGHYNAELIIPLLSVSALSAWFAGQWVSGSLYDIALLRRGLDFRVTRGLKVLLEGRKVREVMNVQVESFPANATLGQMIDVVSHGDQESYPVLSAHQELIGVVTMDVIRQTLNNAGSPGLILACDLLSATPATVDAGTSLDEVWPLFKKYNVKELLVVKADPAQPDHVHPVGRIRQDDLLPET